MRSFVFVHVAAALSPADMKRDSLAFQCVKDNPSLWAWVPVVGSATTSCQVATPGTLSLEPPIPLKALTAEAWALEGLELRNLVDDQVFDDRLHLRHCALQLPRSGEAPRTLDEHECVATAWCRWNDPECYVDPNSIYVVKGVPEISNVGLHKKRPGHEVSSDRVEATVVSHGSSHVRRMQDATPATDSADASCDFCVAYLDIEEDMVSCCLNKGESYFSLKHDKDSGIDFFVEYEITSHTAQDLIDYKVQMSESTSNEHRHVYDLFPVSDGPPGPDEQCANTGPPNRSCKLLGMPVGVDMANRGLSSRGVQDRRMEQLTAQQVQCTCKWTSPWCATQEGYESRHCKAKCAQVNKCTEDVSLRSELCHAIAENPTRQECTRPESD